jgi:ribonuclease D
VVHREFVAAGLESYWSFAVEVSAPATSAAGADASAPPASGRTRIDYREVLPPEQFAIFAQLRQWRKQTAEAAGVPVYNIFTNEQLAEIVRQLPPDPTSLGKIVGIGEARVRKHGEAVLAALSAARADSGAASA